MSASTGAAARGGDPKRVRVWPPTRPPGPGEAVRVTCVRCDLDWDVHEALAGFRLRCECDAWVPVPHPLGAPARVLPAPELPPLAFPPPPPAGLKRLAKRPARKSVEPKEPAPPRKRARLFDKGLFGTLFLTAATVVPVLAATDELGPMAWAVLWPAIGAAATILLGALALAGKARYVASIRPARFLHVAEGLGVGLFGGALLATALAELPSDAPATQWLLGFVDELGVPLSAVALVLMPAFAHAFFFREVFARRLQSLFSPGTAAALAAVLLAFSHGLAPISVALFGFALHAAWLRKRSGSVLPGLIEDFALAGVTFGALLAA